MRQGGKKTTELDGTKKLIYGLKVFSVAMGVIMTVAFFIWPMDFPKIASYLATIILPFIPNFFRKTKLRISDKLELAYLAFLIPAMIFGIDLDFYRLIYNYDKIVHLISGILAVVAAKEFLEQGAESKSKWFTMLFMLSFTTFTAVGWESFEFFFDLFFKGQMQELIIPGLSDTMWDMIASLAGGMIAGFVIVH